MSSGAIKPTYVLEVDEPTLVEARTRCAARARARGEDELAAAFEAGSQDQGWALRYEVELIGKERAAAARAAERLAAAEDNLDHA